MPKLVYQLYQPPPNYAKLYFDAKFLEKGLNMEERGWVKFLWLFF